MNSPPLPTSQDSDEVIFVAAAPGGQPPDPPSTTTLATDPDDRPRYRLFSWVWNHGNLSFSNRGQRLWKCNHCAPHRPIIYHCSSTTHISHHLRSRHNIRRELVTPTPATVTQQTLATMRPSQIVVRKALVSWVLHDYQAFRQVESPQFKQFLAAVMPLQPNSFLPSRNTLRNWVLDTFDDKKPFVLALLAAATSHIHVSVDTWTSPNHLSFLAIVIHFADNLHRWRTLLLALKEIQSSHVGVHLATIVMTVLKEFDIVNKIGYFMSDNASNMDTAIEEISRQLFVLGNTILTADERRLRCWGHVLNLVAKDVLGGNKKGSIDESAFEAIDPRDIAEQRAAFLHWRQYGPVEKLHAFTVFLRGSPARRHLFTTIQSEHLHQPSTRMIRLANSTRGTLRST